MENDSPKRVVTLLKVDETLHSKIEFVGGYNPTIPSPIFPQFSPQNALSVVRSERHSFEPCPVSTVCDV